MRIARTRASRLLLLAAVLCLPLRAAAVDSWSQAVGNTVMPLSDGFGTNGLANTGNKCVDALTSFNGCLYAVVGQNGSGSGNTPSVWRTSDLLHWTNGTVGGFPGTDLYIDANTNGIFLGTGNKSAMAQAQVWKSANGLSWTSFTGGGSGYNPTNNFLVLPGLQGPTLYAATANPNGGQVWKRPVNGSSTWAKVLDFNSGFGTAYGPQTNLWSACLYCPPSATNVMFYGTLGGQWSALYQSADGGASWQKNAAVASSFGTNSSEISALAEFNGFLYAGCLAAQGGCLWRTPLANATNWSSTAAWQQVVSGGFSTNSSGELHRLVAAYGNLWVCLAGPNAQVWRSADGTNWVQSNVSGFATNNNAQGGYQALAAFTNTDGNAFMAWGGPWANPTNSSSYAAQVWVAPIAVAVAPAITVQPQSVSTNIGATVSFSVGATGSPPFSYQWQMNTTNILNATNATLVLNNIQPSNAGGYDVIVSDAAGGVTSLVATLSVSPAINTNAPPMPGIAGTNYSQTLSASAGAPPYAWSLVGGALPDGLTLSSAGLISGTPTAVGTFNFTVQIADALGQIGTGAFNIAVTDPWVQIVGNGIVPLGDGFGADGAMNTNNTMIQSLAAYNGFLYAGVETVAYRPSIWRSSDMLNWTNILINAPPDFHNIFDMQANSNGIFFGSGYGAFPSGAQIWKSTNGLAWSVFSTTANGFPTNYVNPVYVSLQGNALYAAPGSATSCQVWRRPADGSANWTELLDFNTGFGSADGVRTNMGISYVYCPPGATNAVFIPCGDGASSNCLLYVSADGGATWHMHAGVGNGFGDTNNGYIASVIEFNGYLYAGTGAANGSSGAQIWRTPLATATNWSSTNAWQQVVGGGFGYPSTECHRFAVAGGELWTFLFTHTNLKAKLWRSGDGLNWVQSNLDDFGADHNACNGALGSFTGTNGNSYMLWGGGWTCPTNPAINAAQIWATQLGSATAPAISNQPSMAGITGTSYSQTLSASAGAPPYTWALVGGALPDGLTLSSAGLISGTPTAAGTFNFTVQVTDAVGQIATGTFGIVMTDPWFQVVGNSIVPLGDGFGVGGAMNTNNNVVESLNQYNGFLYAGVETVSNHPSIWRSSDLVNWTNIPFTFSFFLRNIGDMQSNTNGIFFGSGYGGSPTGAQIWKSTDGLNWFVFNTPASGFYETNTAVMITLQSNALYAAIPNPTNVATEVWKRPADGSANWTKVLDFNTGLGCPDGPQPILFSYIYGPPGATNAVFLPSNDATGCWIYESADGGTTWHKNAAMAGGFGDTNNYIASMIEFNGCIYAGTGNPNGGQIWRKPLADAVNWSSTNAWQQVATGGLGSVGTEFHRFAVAGGELWTFFAAHGPKEQVWRSDDGTNWVQSNVDGFGTTDYAGANCLASFAGTNGHTCMVWGGYWTNPTNSSSTAAQIWATPTPAADSPAIAASSPPPSGVVGAGYSLTLSASGGTPAYTWSLIGGALPDGLTLSRSGQISGTPAASGLFTFTVLVTDAAGQSATSSFTITVADLWAKMVGNGMTLFDGFGGATNTPANQAVEWLQAFNGQLYAAVGQQESGVGNPVSIWRSSDLTNWTQVGAGTLSTNDTDIYSMVTDGTRLFAGTKAASGGANIYASTNGSAWSLFNATSNGFNRSGMTWASHLGILNGNLFAGILTTNGSGQVRKCSVAGPTNWTKVVDFSNGQGLPSRWPVPGINAMYFYAVSNTLFMPAGNFLYQSTDAVGTNWVKNAQVGAGFGDANNLNISSLVDFNGYLYAPTHNTSTGGQLWRTPLTNALANGALPWTKVVDSAFGQGPQFTELHHITVGLGCLWISVQGPVAQVWRSADGTTWVQSNIDGFDASNPATSFKPVVATFNNAAVWGGASGTNATGAQVWEAVPCQQALTCWFGAAAGPGGSVGGDTNGWYALGGSVTVTATPAAYYRFSGWTGDVPSVQFNNNPLTLILDQSRSIGAVFAQNQGTNYGTPYVWLAGHGFTSNMSAAELLIGGNGLPVWQSYVADLNPTDAISRFVILAFTNAPGGRVNAAFNSSTGRIYGLQCSTNLLLGNGWFGVNGQSNIWGNGVLKVLSDTNAASPRFYRVQVQLPGN